MLEDKMDNQDLILRTNNTFFFTTMPKPVWGHLPLTYWALGIKWPQYEADCSPPSSIKVKNSQNIIPIPQYTNSCRRIRHRSKFLLLNKFHIHNATQCVQTESWRNVCCEAVMNVSHLPPSHIIFHLFHQMWTCCTALWCLTSAT